MQNLKNKDWNSLIEDKLKLFLYITWRELEMTFMTMFFLCKMQHSECSCQDRPSSRNQAANIQLYIFPPNRGVLFHSMKWVNAPSTRKWESWSFPPTIQLLVKKVITDDNNQCKICRSHETLYQPCLSGVMAAGQAGRTGLYNLDMLKTVKNSQLSCKIFQLYIF